MANTPIQTGATPRPNVPLPSFSPTGGKTLNIIQAALDKQKNGGLNTIKTPQEDAFVRQPNTQVPTTPNQPLADKPQVAVAQAGGQFSAQKILFNNAPSFSIPPAVSPSIQGLATSSAIEHSGGEKGSSSGGDGQRGGNQ